MKYLVDPYKKWNNISERASRDEFWIFFLIFTIVAAPLGFIASMLNSEIIIWVYRIAFLVPFISLGFRRLNDIGINKYLFLIPLVNLILAALPPRKNSQIA